MRSRQQNHNSLNDRSSSALKQRRALLKRILANITIGNDLSSLFPELVEWLDIPDLECKRMTQFYISHYAKGRSELCLLACVKLSKETKHPDPRVRTLALRTLANITIGEDDGPSEILSLIIEPFLTCLRDSDPYVVKTALANFSKLRASFPTLIESDSLGVIERLKDMLNHSNAMVVANALATLTTISSRVNSSLTLNFTFTLASKLLTALDECNEWCQVYILESMKHVLPLSHEDAEMLSERVSFRLQHANSAVVIAAVGAIVYFMHYIASPKVTQALLKKMGTSLLTLLHEGVEISYIGLQTIHLILSKYSYSLASATAFIKSDNVKMFFCKFEDPLYIKLAKLKIVSLMARPDNANIILTEYSEYASQVDVDFVKLAVSLIGDLAVQVPQKSEDCINNLMNLISNSNSPAHVIHATVLCVKTIMRGVRSIQVHKQVISLCEKIDVIEQDGEALAALLWILKMYCSSVPNASSILSRCLDSYDSITDSTKLILLSSTICFFFVNPSIGQPLISRMFSKFTEHVGSPDVRDRAFLYWRLLSKNPLLAKEIIGAHLPIAETDTVRLSPNLVRKLVLCVGTVATVYQQFPSSFLQNYRPLVLYDSPAYLAWVPSADSESPTPPSPLKSIYPDIVKQVLPHPFGMESKSFHHMQGTFDLDLLESQFGETSRVSSPSRPQSDMYIFDPILNPSGTQEVEANRAKFSVNPRSSSALSIESYSRHNPFSNVSSDPQGQERSYSAFNSSARSSRLELNDEPIIDPFGQTSSGGRVSRLSSSRTSMPLHPVDVVQVLLDLEAGVEIKAAFVGRLGVLNLYLEFALSGAVSLPLHSFKIQFNKNILGIGPNAPLTVQEPVLQGSYARALPLPCSFYQQLREDPTVPTLPASTTLTVQIAISTSMQIFYFAVPLPLEAVFVPHPPLPDAAWITGWQSSSISVSTLQLVVPRPSSLASVYYSAEQLSVAKMLELACISTTTSRLVDSMVHLYSSIVLADGTLFLLDIGVDQSESGSLAFACTFKTIHEVLLAPFRAAMDSVLKKLFSSS